MESCCSGGNAFYKAYPCGFREQQPQDVGVSEWGQALVCGVLVKTDPLSIGQNWQTLPKPC